MTTEAALPAREDALVDAGAPRPARMAGAAALVALSACCFGSIPVLTTIALRGGATLITVLFWRYAIGAVLLLAAAGGVATIVRPGRTWVPLLVLAGGGQALIGYTSLSALRFIPAATLTFLFYSYPAWVALIAAVRGSERLTARRAIALAISLLGIVVMTGNPWGGGLHPAGVALALASALLYAAYIPLLDHFQRTTPRAVTAAAASGGAAIALAVAGGLTGTLTMHLSATSWEAAVVLGVVSTALAFLAFLGGLKTLGPVRAAIVSTVEPFWSAMLATVALGQPLSGGTIAGGALIATAVVILSRR